MNAHKRRKLVKLARFMGKDTLAPQNIELKEEVLPVVEEVKQLEPVAAVEEVKTEPVVVESVTEVVASEPAVVEKPVAKKKKTV